MASVGCEPLLRNRFLPNPAARPLLPLLVESAPRRSQLRMESLSLGKTRCVMEQDLLLYFLWADR